MLAPFPATIPIIPHWDKIMLCQQRINNMLYSAAYLENRQGGRGNHKMAHLVKLRAPGRKRAIGAAVCSRAAPEKAEAVLADSSSINEPRAPQITN